MDNIMWRIRMREGYFSPHLQLHFGKNALLRFWERQRPNIANKSDGCYFLDLTLVKFCLYELHQQISAMQKLQIYIRIKINYKEFRLRLEISTLMYSAVLQTKQLSLKRKEMMELDLLHKLLTHLYAKHFIIAQWKQRSLSRNFGHSEALTGDTRRHMQLSYTHWLFKRWQALCIEWINFFSGNKLSFVAASWKKLSTWDFMWSLVALSRGAGEKEDAADLVLSLSSYEETANLPWNSGTSIALEVEKLNYSGKRLVQLAFSNKPFKITIDSIGTIESAVSWQSWNKF